MFLCATYGYLLLVGANLISDGSELLLEVASYSQSLATQLLLLLQINRDPIYFRFYCAKNGCADQVMDPGLIGGLVLPILGALPDSAMIVVSGLAGTIEEAKEQVSAQPASFHPTALPSLTGPVFPPATLHTATCLSL